MVIIVQRTTYIGGNLSKQTCFAVFMAARSSRTLRHLTMKYLQGISLISLQKAESYQPGTKLALSKPEGKGCELSFQTPPGWSCLLAWLMGGDQPAPSLLLVDPPTTKASRRAEGEPSGVGPAPYPPYDSSPPVVEPKLGVVPRTLWVWNLFQRFRSSLLL